MAYKLTQADVDKLASLKMFDALEGDTATREELAALGIQPEEPPAIVTMGGAGEPMKVEIAPPASTGGLNEYSAFRSLGMEPDVAEAARAAINGTPLPAPDTSIEQAPPISGSGASDMSGLLSMLAMQPQAQQYSTDPFEGLSRNQKMMLAFSAIKDAGMALQGKEGGAFEKTLGRFNDIRDIERKRQAAQAQQALMAKLYGVGGAGMAGPVDFSTMDVEGLEAYRRKLLESGFVINPATGEPLIPTDVTKLRIDEIDRAITAKKLGEKKAVGEQEQIDMLTPIVSGALDYINPQGLLDERGEPVLNPDIAGKITRGWAAFSEDPNYMRFSNQLGILKSTYTFENMTRLKEQGVAFGGLSEGELGQVAALIGTLDPKDPLGTFSTLKRIDEKLNKKAKKVSPQSQGGDGLTYNPETGEFE